MPPDEILPIVIISILAFTGLSIYIIHTISSFLRDRSGIKENRKEQSQSSLTSSELENMLRRVVQEVTSPMADRIAALEDQLSATPPVRTLPEARKTINEALDEALDDEGPQDLAAISRRTRIEE